MVYVAPLVSLAQLCARFLLRFRQVVLLIDALDEASAGSTASGRMDSGENDDGDSDGAAPNELLALIRDRFVELPPWVRFVITTRPKDERNDVPEDERDLLAALHMFSPKEVQVSKAGNRNKC